MTIKEIAIELHNFKSSPAWTDTIAYLNDNDIEYDVESGRDTKWSDLDIYNFYLENKEKI